MLPVALLSFCGIMLGIGSSLSSKDVITLIPFLGTPVLQAIFIWMSKVGSFAFSFLPVMFCIAIPLGLARENKGVAAFAGFVGYAVMNLAVNFWLTAKGILPTTDAAVLKANNIQSVIGIQSIDTGILGAVIAGVIIWMLHERFHNIRLPDACLLRRYPLCTNYYPGGDGSVWFDHSADLASLCNGHQRYWPHH